MNYLYEIIACIVGTFGFSVIIKVSKQKIIYTVIGGAISASISLFLMRRGVNSFVYTFTAMAVVAAYSEILARLTKTPANVILLPSTIPLLPGGYLYYTMNYLINFNKDKFIFYAKETTFAGFGIALGGLFVSIIVVFINDFKMRISKRHKSS